MTIRAITSIKYAKIEGQLVKFRKFSKRAVTLPGFCVGQRTLHISQFLNGKNITDDYCEDLLNKQGQQILYVILQEFPN